MNYFEEALRLHSLQGKNRDPQQNPGEDRDALATATRPRGGAMPPYPRGQKRCLYPIRQGQLRGRRHRRHRGPGLGNIGRGALPSGGQVLLFKEFGGVDAFPSVWTPPTRRKSSGPCGISRPSRRIIWRTSRLPSASRSKRGFKRSLTSPSPRRPARHGHRRLRALLNALRVVGKRSAT
jgi:hypothetical protein